MSRVGAGFRGKSRGEGAEGRRGRGKGSKDQRGSKGQAEGRRGEGKKEISNIEYRISNKKR
ncbi:MAG: hypothetical protein EHM61_02680 [Acidobacteria bacterium]|nr:MAG: hypothetical protein EHM61_02680 [Acidobacteriota bacterium]